VEIWAQVLGIGEVGIDEDFFALGGHSLLAARVIARIREVFQLELPVRILFEHPTIAACARELARPAQWALPPVRAQARRSAEVPLSFAQERLWFLEQWQPATALYTLALALPLAGSLRFASLEWSLNEILRRHEVLRSYFSTRDGQPVQQIAPWRPLPLALLDLSALPASARTQACQELATREARRPFDLACAPLLRAQVLRLDTQTQRLLLTFHHIVFDARSLEVLTHELNALCAAHASGQPSPLPALPIQYADYAHWQRALLQGARLHELETYWRQALAGAPVVLELPTDRPQPRVQSFAGAHYPLSIDETVARSLQALARREGTTLFLTLLAALQVLLWRYSGQVDFLIGTPVASREQPEVEQLIGFFPNTLVLRANLAGNPSVRQLLARVRATALGAYAHQDLPFEQVVDLLQPARDPGQTPLFQVLFTLQPRARQAGPPEVESGMVKFALTLAFQESERGLRGVLGYQTDLFEQATIARLAAQLRTLLAGIAASPEQRIADLPLLTPAEREALLSGAQRDLRTYPRQDCLHTRFAARVALSPEAIALVYEDAHFTYRAVERRANALARSLQALGAGAHTLVGLCLPRSPDLVISLLAILKAGAAYVPLDPDLPAERLAFLLADARVPVLLTRRQERLPAGGARVLYLDDEPAPGAEDVPLPESGVCPQDAAYVIYTSGSTGVPKGVVIHHEHVSRLFAACAGHFALSAGDTWTLFHSFAFDFSVWEIWGALLSGGRLVIVPYLLSRSPQDFCTLLCQQGVTILNQTPSAFRLLLQGEQLLACDLALRLLIFGGEALSPQLLQPWFARYGARGAQLVNMYGITETTVHVTCRPLSPADLQAGARSLIGRPLPDLQVYILDAHLQPLPVGVPGELYVGGAGLARGYLSQPALTAERFLPHPFAQEAGARLYRSGDRARLLASGEIEYLGRTDAQVKLRGFRIEPAEIEAALRAHPAIQAAVVVVRPDATGQSSLVAYVVAGPQGGVDTGEVRAHLRARLPEYMLPATIVPLEALPLSANGKLDLRALPAPAEIQSAPEPGERAPQTPGEEVLAGIWSQVLGRAVGREDNFFALGGDSLRSVQVLALARQRGLSCTLQQFFQARTLSQLARLLQEAEPEPAPAAQPFALLDPQDRALLPADLQDAYPLTMLQHGMLFHSEYSAGSALYHNITSLRLSARFEQAYFAQALAHLLAAHPVLRTSFDLSSYRVPLQLVQRTVPLPLQVVDLRQETEARQEEILAHWLAEERERTFDWTRAPLLRFQVHLRGEKSWQCTLTEHHAILDGWSVATLLTELLQHYVALLRAEPAPPRPAPVASFRSAVALEQQALADPQMQDYWLQKLAGCTIMALPRALPSPGQAPQRRVLTVPIAGEISAGLKRCALAEAVPLKSVLLAAHLNVLRLLGGQADVLTGLVTNGRPETSDGERVAGLFLNTLPYRQLLPAGSWRELVQATFAGERELLPFRRYPLAQIQHLLGGRALFASAFNFNHFRVYQGLQGLPDLQISDRQGFAQTSFALVAHFSLAPTSGQVQLHLEWDPAILSAQAGASLAQLYTRTLAAIAADPTARYEQHNPLTHQERAQRQAWNATTRPPAAHLASQLATRCAQSPEAIALVYEDACLTYQELHRRARRLAHHLRALGVGPDVPVGLCLPRSLDLVIALLAILKAGGVAIPLDVNEPARRLSALWQEARPALLLTRAGQATNLPAEAGPQLGVQAAHLSAGAEADRDPACAQHDDHLAYIIYTSGSTGTPKGAMNTQRGLANRLQWMQEACGLRPGDRVLQKTPSTFDVAIWEFFWPLLAGATLVVLPPDLQRDPAALVATIARQQITTLHFVPSQLNLFLQERGLQDCRGLRQIICSGEALSPQVQQRCLALLPAALYNLYGPSEAAIDVSAWRCLRGDQRPFVPLGRPIANTRIHVLDAHLQPVPLGVVGELYIGGAGLARGYLARADLTAARFLPDPDPGQPGARLYRTGDLACYHRDGTLEFLGRRDQQVKLHGVRIEPAEIEAALTRHPALRAAVVTVREDTPGDRRLVAYVVPARARGAPGHSELRSFLQDYLPASMLPAAFVVLEALPLSRNGKLERRALPAPERARPALARAYVAARTPIEEVLASIWGDVLGLQRVGRHDSFFELGGNSLLATQVVARMRSALRIELPLRSLFEAPTVAQLAGQVERQRQVAPGAPVPPLFPLPHAGAQPVSFAQQRLWLLEQLGQGGYTLPARTRLCGPLAVAALAASLNVIVERHEVLRTTFTVDSSGQPAQVIGPPRARVLPVISLEALEAGARERVALDLATAQGAQPFDLARGPLWRAHLVRLSTTEHLLLLTLHHIVADGWSLGVLFQELSALYPALLAGRPSPLPPLPIQYADVARGLRQWLQGEVLAEHLAWWRQTLAGAPTLLDLPTDYPRPQVLSQRGAHHPFTLSREMSAQLQALSQRAGATLYMTLLATLQVFLARYSGQRDLLIGTPIANRTWSEQEQLIGCFINTLVIRSDLSGQPTFLEVLARVRQRTLSAYAHQDLPFEALVEHLQPERSLSSTPLFQVMFVLQNTPQPARTLGDLHLQPLELATDTSRFALTLALVAGEQGLRGTWEYSTDLFGGGTIARWHTHFLTLLHALLAHPQLPIATLPLLPPAEHTALLARACAPSLPFSSQPSLLTRLAEHVARTPDSLALLDTASNAHLSYHHLAARVSLLALHLLHQGLLPEDRVGLCLPRGLDLLTALLAVLASGAAYVPLDPSYPPQRLAFLASDAHLSLLLTHRALLPLLPPPHPPVLCLDDPWAHAAAAPHASDTLLTHLPGARPHPQHLAYIIYTSGSTGQPKGVLISHAALHNFWHAAGPDLAAGPTDRVLQLASLSFDASVLEIVLALTAGATLVLAPLDVLGTGAPLAHLLARYAISCLALPPSLLDPLPTDVPLPHLQTLIVGGEACAPATAARWAPGRRFFHAYAPTEATIYATRERCTLPLPRVLSLGQPLANLQVLLLDACGQPVPTGVVGELYLGGAGLARGYHGLPALTAQQFVPHPASRQAGARLYRTGDLARWRGEGRLEFVGRADRQVKVRGVRIEPGEIEGVLAGHPGVRECVVALWEESGGERPLVAYVVAREGERLTGRALRAWLRQRVPEVLVPTGWRMLERWPVTAQGKIDRAALPGPEGAVGDEEKRAARTPLEEVLVEIWAQVLGIGEVGIDEDFFALGGHSLLAARVIARIREVFQVELPLLIIFGMPCIAELATVIAHSQQTAPQESTKIQVLPRGSRDVQQLLTDLQQLPDDLVEQLLASELQQREPEDTERPPDERRPAP
jgi:amino acid adenylation domain-containing protein